MTAAGSVIRQHEAFHSTWLDADRTLTVYEPPGYLTGGPPVPLLLLHDGQNLFDPARAFHGQTWHVAETADRLIGDGTIQPLVICGVDHGGDARVLEYTPTAGRHPGAGQIEEHAHFLVDEVVPFLARAYHVRTDFEGLGLGGSSLGGLATLGVALAQPGRFGRLIVMSPSVWWDRRAILGQLRRAPLRPTPRVWVDAGLQEGARTVHNARDLADLLATAAPTGAAASVRFVADPTGDHSEASWARRFGDALTYCYASPSPT